jgi:hypothetical protein
MATKPPIETAIILKKTDPKKACYKFKKNTEASGKISPAIRKTFMYK